MAVDDLKVTVWVNAEWYLSVADEYRSMFVAGAADMLAAILPTVVPEHLVRLCAMVDYANTLDNNALRDLLDRFVHNSPDEQKESAVGQLLAALNHSSGFDGVPRSNTKRSPFWHPISFTNRVTRREWRPKPGTALAYYALLLACALLIGVGVAAFTRIIGLGDKQARTAAIFSAILGLVFFVYPLRALIKRIRFSRKALKRFFYEIRTPAEEEALQKSSSSKASVASAGAARVNFENACRVEFDKYFLLTDALRTSYVVGCFEMLNVLSPYVSVDGRSAVMKIRAQTDKLDREELRRRIDEFFSRRRKVQTESTAASILVAFQ